MGGFHGGGRRPYFEGWYFKQQNETDTVALIPAFHIDRAGRRSASLQVVWNEKSFGFAFPEGAFQTGKGGLPMVVGDSVFSARGCRLNARSRGCEIAGELRYGPFQPPAGDIMGPFRFVPFLECRHSVLSLRHRVDGELFVNGKSVAFRGAAGYAEGDRGRSFPRSYAWTQCSAEAGCVMLSAAEVPLGRRCFTGCVGAVLRGGRETRIATYRGAKVLRAGEGEILIRQGGLTLGAKLLEPAGGCLLRAPVEGGMTRTVRESAACRVRYTCRRDGVPLFDFESGRAGFESARRD